MEAVIRTGNKQYQVTKGQKITVEKLDALPWCEVNLDVLALIDETPVYGNPVVQGAKVVAKVLDHTKGDKVTIGKFKRRTGYHKKQGHRQHLTNLEVVDIQKN